VESSHKRGSRRHPERSEGSLLVDASWHWNGALMAISRRYFLKSGGIAMLGMASLPAFLQRAVAATSGPTKKKMVVLFQRGAMDGLNVVVPFAEQNYYQLRPTI